MKRKRPHLQLIRGGLSYEARAKLALYPEPRERVENVVPMRPRPYTPPTRPAA